MAHYKSYADRVKPAHCVAQCAYCGKTYEKRHINCLMLRENGWKNPKVLTFICPNCISNLFEHLEIKEREGK